MDSHKFEEKLDKISEKLASIDTTLAKQSVILEEHVRRTNLLETKLDPIQKHVALIQAGLKILTVFGLGAVAKFFHGLMTR